MFLPTLFATLIVLSPSVETEVRAGFAQVKPTQAELPNFHPFVPRDRQGRLLLHTKPHLDEQINVTPSMRPGTLGAGVRWSYQRVAPNGGNDGLTLDVGVESDADNNRRKLARMKLGDQGHPRLGSLTGRKYADYVDSGDTNRVLTITAIKDRYYVNVVLTVQPDFSAAGERRYAQDEVMLDNLVANLFKRVAEVHWPPLTGSAPPPP